MEDLFVIVAAGKSSRFGGYPKAFCRLGETTIIENTIRLARGFFDKIYVVVNQETHKAGFDQGLDASVLSIITGQGDADSILKSLRQIQVREPAAQRVTVCWGDAVFLDETPFREMQRNAFRVDEQTPILVGCCIDPEPYAWFDVSGSQIVCSHFRKEGERRAEGLHDQSLFIFQIDKTIVYLERYKHHLGLDRYDPNSYDATRGEMKLLNAFTYFYTEPDITPTEFCNLTENRVKSFNTRDELQEIAYELQQLQKQEVLTC